MRTQIQAHVEPIGMAAITGALSFGHIHELGQEHGYAGWQSYALPLSIDLMASYAFRRCILAKGIARGARIFGWFVFLLSLSMSIGANLLTAPPGDPIGLALSAWPGVAFAFAAVLFHVHAPASAASPVANDLSVSYERQIQDLVLAFVDAWDATHKNRRGMGMALTRHMEAELRKRELEVKSRQTYLRILGVARPMTA
jgi:hypothetical protein